MVVAVTVSGCASDKASRAEVDTLTARVQALEAKYAVAAGRFSEIERLSQISYAVQDRVEEIGLAQNKHARVIVQLQQEYRAAQAKPPAQPAAAPQRVVAQQPLPAVVSAEARALQQPTDANLDGTAQEVYTRAYALLQEKRYDDAGKLFAYVMQVFAKDELADNAMYWLAEIEYNGKKYLEALKMFEELPRRFPTGNKVPAAKLKAAFCYGKLGDKAKGRQVAQQLIKDYPWSAEAEKAEEALSSGELL